MSLVYVDHTDWISRCQNKAVQWEGRCGTAAALPFDGNYRMLSLGISSLSVRRTACQAIRYPSTVFLRYYYILASKLWDLLALNKSNQIIFLKFRQLWGQISNTPFAEMVLSLWGSVNTMIFLRRANSVTAHEWCHCLHCWIFSCVGYSSDITLQNVCW